MTNAEFFRLTNFLMQFVVPNEIGQADVRADGEARDRPERRL